MTAQAIQTQRSLAELFRRAETAGRQAAAETTPEPMVVIQHENPASDSSKVIKRWTVPGGPCGSAGVRIRPGNSTAAQFAIRHLDALSLKGYGGGVLISISRYGQSLDWKSAHARAYAAILRTAGIEAYADCRID